MSMAPIEFRLADGRVLIGPPSLVPPSRRAQFRDGEALRRLFARADAVAQLRAGWKRIATPGDHAQYISTPDLKRALERSIAVHRLAILWLPSVKDVRFTPPGKDQAAAPAPNIPGHGAAPAPAKPAAPVAVSRLSRLERLERALALSFRYVGPELRAKLAQLDPVQIARDLAIVALAIAVAQLGGVTAAEIDAALLAIAYVLAGWTGLQGAWEFGAAAVAAVTARTDKDIDNAAHGFARAFTKLGEAVILWLIARISKPRADKAKGGPQREASGRLADRDYVDEPSTVRRYGKEPPKSTVQPRPGQTAIDAARADQAKWGYKPDEWGVKDLKVGDRVLGGVPGQSAYYTDAQTLSASGGSRTSLFESLQVKPHPEFGYRPMVAEYEVVRDMQVPFGVAKANGAFGAGGGNQFFIGNYAESLRLVRQIPLGK